MIIHLYENSQILLVSISTLFMLILGFIVYFHDQTKSINKIFILLALTAGLWGFFNYLYNQPNLGNLALFFLRIHMFLSVWYAFWIYMFFYILKKDLNEEKIFLDRENKVIFLIGLFVSLLNLTPLVFEKILNFTENGQILNLKTNFGIIFFGIFILFLFVFTIINFFKNKDKNKYAILFIGFILSFVLHIIFNFIFPNVFNNIKYVGFGSLFTIPFIFFAGYAILKTRFLNIRIVTTDIFIIILLVLTSLQILNAQTLIDVLIRFFIFILVILFSAVLIRGIRREIQQTEELEKLNAELDRANKLKSEFLSFASHQLKSPMAVIKGYVTLMMDGTIPNVPDQVKDFASKIKKSIDDLLTLIEEFMDYRKIDENKFDFNFEEVEIVDFVKNIFENYKLIAQNKNLEFSLETDISAAKVLIDKIRFAQVIQNLIDNAIKYTKQGFVKVCLTLKGDDVLICVKDSGIGMTKELQEKLFSQFVRDPAIKKEIQGTGLGLYIAKYIVENHKGKIWAESEGKDKGSEFYVQIPKIKNNL